MKLVIVVAEQEDPVQFENNPVPDEDVKFTTKLEPIGDRLPYASSIATFIGPISGVVEARFESDADVITI